jgi:hypothetical protein
MINLTHTISILNSVFTVVFYATRWTKLDTDCIYFEEFVNQLICSIVGSWTKCFCRAEYITMSSKWIFYILLCFQFCCCFLCTFDLCLFWAKKIHHYFIILNFVIQSCSTTRGYHLVFSISVMSLSGTRTVIGVLLNPNQWNLIGEL